MTLVCFHKEAIRYKAAAGVGNMMHYLNKVYILKVLFLYRMQDELTLSMLAWLSRMMEAWASRSNTVRSAFLE